MYIAQYLIIEISNSQHLCPKSFTSCTQTKIITCSSSYWLTSKRVYSNPRTHLLKLGPEFWFTLDVILMISSKLLQMFSEHFHLTSDLCGSMYYLCGRNNVAFSHVRTLNLRWRCFSQRTFAVKPLDDRYETNTLTLASASFLIAPIPTCLRLPAILFGLTSSRREAMAEFLVSALQL